MLLRSDARRGRDDLLDITLSLPFQGEVNTGFGVLAKVYLDALTHINGGTRVVDPNAEGVADAKAMALEICEETFPGVKLPKHEVERGFRFWDVVRIFSFCSILCKIPWANQPLCVGADSDETTPCRRRCSAGIDRPVRGGRIVVGTNASLSCQHPCQVPQAELASQFPTCPKIVVLGLLRWACCNGL